MSWKIGIVGGGAIARACHIPGYALNPNCKLTAIADPAASSLADVRKNWSFAHEYADYHEMFHREKLDIVSICTPNKFHADAAIAAMESGADLILEKPVAMSIEEAEKIRAVQKRTGRRIAVGFPHRCNNMVRDAHEAVAGGMIGELYMIYIRFAHTGPFPGWAVSDWFYNPAMAGGGAGLDMGIHAIDLVHYFAGPITEVTAFAGTLRKKIEVDDNMVSLCRIGNRCMAILEAGWTSCSGFEGFELRGDKGSIFVNYSTGEAIARTGVCKPDGSTRMEQTVISKRGKSSWAYEMAEILSAFADGTAFPATLDDGISALRVALAAYQANKTGKAVALNC